MATIMPHGPMWRQYCGRYTGEGPESRGSQFNHENCLPRVSVLRPGRPIHSARRIAPKLKSRYNPPMSPDAERLLEQARLLPPDQRAWLVESLLNEDESASPAEIEAAWGDEIKRRLDEIDSGAVEMIPGDEVMAGLLDRLSPEARTRLGK